MKKKSKPQKKKIESRLKKGLREFKSDLNKLRKGELEPRIFKKKSTVKNPTRPFARNLTGRGGDPVSTPVKAKSPVQKAAKSYAKKAVGKGSKKK